MRLVPVILLSALVFTNCKDRTLNDPVTAPEDLLPEDKLVDVLIDLQILESQYQFRYQRPDIYKLALDSAGYFVFEKHGTTEEQYLRSYDYYSTNIDKMYLIYETALDSVNLMISNEQQAE